MKTSALITVVDENPANQSALRFLIISSRIHKVNIPIFVLHPKSLLPNKLIKWLSKENIQTFSYNMTREDNDPYFAKFLIKSFIDSEKLGYDDAYCYLDPDHIFLDNFILPHTVHGKIFISSEEADAFNVHGYSTRYYNTSLIHGTMKTILSAMEYWTEEYGLMKHVVDNRHREEMAFVLSCQKKGVALQPVKASFQGNFKNLNEKCSIFHYGGDSQCSVMLKGILANGVPSGYITTIQKNCSSPVEKSIFDEFKKIMEMDKEWQI